MLRLSDRGLPPAVPPCTRPCRSADRKWREDAFQYRDGAADAATVRFWCGDLLKHLTSSVVGVLLIGWFQPCRRQLLHDGHDGLGDGFEPSGDLLRVISCTGLVGGVVVPGELSAVRISEDHRCVEDVRRSWCRHRALGMDGYADWVLIEAGLDVAHHARDLLMVDG